VREQQLSFLCSNPFRYTISLHFTRLPPPFHVGLTRGYMEAVREIEQQLGKGEAGGASGFDDIAMACGSGGTSAGLALGVHLSTLSTRVHAYSVCDTPPYFYDYIQGLVDGVTSVPGSLAARDLLRVIDVKGAGYAISAEEELQLVQSVAQSTGIVLDPVYRYVWGRGSSCSEIPSEN
ncbi:unnamed protein product, partial [Closterium sp. NIES-53]